MMSLRIYILRGVSGIVDRHERERESPLFLFSEHQKEEDRPCVYEENVRRSAW